MNLQMFSTFRYIFPVYRVKETKCSFLFKYLFFLIKIFEPKEKETILQTQNYILLCINILVRYEEYISMRCVMEFLGMFLPVRIMQKLFNANILRDV